MTVRGVVVRGKGEARRIGYPTANVAGGAHREALAQSGVFLAHVLVDNVVYQALAVVGMWTEKNTGHPSLEAHLLDFTGDLYDKTIAVSVGKKLRDLQAFNGPEALVAQIAKDVEDARAAFR